MTAPTDPALPTAESVERIDLPGGWYFRRRDGHYGHWYTLYRPDGLTAPSSWYEHEACALAAALRASPQQPGNERVKELKEQIDNLCLQGLELMADKEQAVKALAAAEARIAALTEALEPFALQDIEKVRSTGDLKLWKSDFRRTGAALDATTTSQERKDV